MALQFALPFCRLGDQFFRSLTDIIYLLKAQVEDLFVTCMYRAGRPLCRKDLKILFWEVPRRIG